MWSSGLAHADPLLRLFTPRGAPIEVLVERPATSAPTPVVVLGSGSGYPMRGPLLEAVAKQLVGDGNTVVRFNWAYVVRDPERGKRSPDRSEELEDLKRVLSYVKTQPWTVHDRVWVGGKSLGSIVAWQALRADPSLAGGILLTPVCTKKEPPLLPAHNYPDLARETRPTVWLLGDNDPVCEPRALLSYVATAARAHRVSILSGNHGLESGATTASALNKQTERTLGVAAATVAEFVANTTPSQ